jgi:hypothetical protein
MRVSELNRTLVLVHLRTAAARNLARCTKLWTLDRDHYPGGSPFTRRISVGEEGSHLPEVRFARGKDHYLYSQSGSLEDYQLPARRYHCEDEIIPGETDLRYRVVDQPVLSHASLIQKGESIFVLGGGNLDHCLANAFESLVRIKLEQGERLEVIIPLFMTYHSTPGLKAEEYIKNNKNKYRNALETKFGKGDRPGYLIFIDNQLWSSNSLVNRQVGLNWFTTLRAMFQSSFFPEIDGKPKPLSRLMTYFSDRT